MNPWAGLIIVFAILLIIVAWKGTQDNVISALLNRPYTSTPTASTSSTAGGGTVNLAATPSTSGLSSLPGTIV